ncbi:hypothetical protein IE4771_PB00338 (plasmid) [Rhizobium etli bv. mimosae str. IE4771]|uniref:Uncharacterized protein n=1 Tax=Rhizobium etli bv. mimosae str. IE4771 TaxID=1432050 RepID=A0A060I8P6_RHIET|nr:hypothetical protein IE4771_PB00338 [Rhizobium sp. IE4771]
MNEVGDQFFSEEYASRRINAIGSQVQRIQKRRSHNYFQGSGGNLTSNTDGRRRLRRDSHNGSTFVAGSRHDLLRHPDPAFERHIVIIESCRNDLPALFAERLALISNVPDFHSRLP